MALYIPKNDLERSMLLTDMVEGTSQDMLEMLGETPPFAVKLLGEECQPKSYFPQDSHPNATFQELFDLAVAWLRNEDDAEVVGLVLLVGMIGEEDPALRCLTTQLETATSQVSLLYPCELIGGAWRLSEPQVVDGLLVAEGILWRSGPMN